MSAERPWEDAPEVSADAPWEAAPESTTDALALRKQRADRFIKKNKGLLPKAVEEFYGGLGHSMHKIGYGAKGLFSDLTPEEKETLEEGKAYVAETGKASSIGEFAGDVGGTAPLGGGVVGGVKALGAKFLPKAAAAVAPVANWGSKYFNLGTAARAGAEGAVTGGLMAPSEGESRLGNAAQGAALSAAVPAVLAPVTKGAGAVINRVIPTEAATTQRAGRVFEKTLGKEGAEQVAQVVKNAPESRFPRTTAAITDNPKLGGLEAGARIRDTAGFASHDEKMATEVFNNLLTDTSVKRTPEQLASRAERVKQAGSAVLDKYKAMDGDKSFLQNEVLKVLDSSDVRNVPELNNKFMNILAKLEDEFVSAADIRTLREQLKTMPNVPGVTKLIDDFTQTSDMVSKGSLAKVEAAIEKTAKDVDDAKAADIIRRRFRSDKGTARGPGIYKVGDEEIPVIKGGQLREAITKQEDKLSPQRFSDLKDITETLRKHELYNPVSDVRGSTADIESLRGPVARAVSASPFWKARALTDWATGASDKATLKKVDEALLNPEKYIALMEAKKLRGQPLTATEQKIMQAIFGPARAIGAEQGEY